MAKINPNKDFILLGTLGVDGIHTLDIQKSEYLANKINYKVLLVESNSDDVLVIDGVKYVKIHDNNNEIPYKSRPIKLISYDNHLGNDYKRVLNSNIDIVEEFKLIKNKNSKLSKIERDMVISEFDKLYKKLE